MPGIGNVHLRAPVFFHAKACKTYQHQCDHLDTEETQLNFCFCVLPYQEALTQDLQGILDSLLSGLLARSPDCLQIPPNLYLILSVHIRRYAIL